MPNAADNYPSMGLRPDAAVAMTYLYLNKYKRYHESSSVRELLDPYVCLSQPVLLAEKTSRPGVAYIFSR